MWCFSVYLGMATPATRAALACPISVCGVLVFTWIRLQQPKSSTSLSYQCKWCFSVYLDKATAATRAELPRSTSVCGVSTLTRISIFVKACRKSLPSRLNSNCHWIFEGCGQKHIFYRHATATASNRQSVQYPHQTSGQRTALRHNPTWNVQNVKH